MFQKEFKNSEGTKILYHDIMLKKKHDKLVFLAKNKFEVLISKVLLDSNIDKEELCNLLKDLI